MVYTSIRGCERAWVTRRCDKGDRSRGFPQADLAGLTRGGVYCKNSPSAAALAAPGEEIRPNFSEAVGLLEFAAQNAEQREATGAEEQHRARFRSRRHAHFPNGAALLIDSVRCRECRPVSGNTQNTIWARVEPGISNVNSTLV